MVLGNSVNAQTTGFQSLNASTGIWNGRTLTPGTGVTITNQTGTGGDPVISAVGSTAVGATNLGIAYSGGTFTVQGASAALSASNIAYVTLQSKTPGLLKTIAVTADQTFTDGSGGQIDNMRWGVTTGINWAEDMPFYLYAVLNDAEDTIAFMISRVPHATNSPAAASIGEAGAVVNVGQGDFFSLLNITAADYEANPCICLGAFRMQFAGATDSYTVQTLTTKDGIGQYHDATVFNFPVSQNGNATNAYFAANGGTAPIFTTQDAKYQMNRHGEVNYIFDTAGTAPSTNGVGAVTLLMNVPLSYMTQSTRASVFKFINSGDTIISIGNAVNPTTAITTLPALRIWNTLANGLILTNADVAGAAKFAGLNFNYVANL